MQEETKKRSSQSLQARLNFDPEYEASLLRHQKERRERDSRQPSVFTRIGKKVVGDQTADLQVSSSSSDSSNNEDEETGHRKSKNRYRNQEDEDMSRPWSRQKVDAFTWRISDFLEDKRRRMPANVKTYNGTEDVGKPRPKWEGPFEVTEALGNGTYKLRDMDGHELPAHEIFAISRDAIFRRGYGPHTDTFTP
nr:reverse transcriptase domain-containing protein [Tanacetum cinerariifolium]